MTTTFSVTKDGKPLAPSLYNWDEKTRTFSSAEDGLVLNFRELSGCTFKTGSDCTFKTGSGCTFDTDSDCTFKTGGGCTFKTDSRCTFNTGWNCTFDTDSYCTFKTGNDCTFKTSSDCTFKTGSDCTFKTGSGCTFKTGSDCTFNTDSHCTFDTGSYCTFDTDWNCTFNTGSCCAFNTSSNCTFKTGWNCTFKTGKNCVNVRRDVFEFYQLPVNKKVQTCPSSIKGYVMDGYYWLDGKKQYKAIIADGILSELVKKKGNVYHVKNHGESNISYLVTDGENWAHGKTLKQAKDDLMYKISDRDTSAYNDFTLDTELTKAEAIKMYRKITGACDTGCKYFCENNAVPEKMTVAQAIELTQGQYNHNLLVKFFENKGGNNDRC